MEQIEAVFFDVGDTLAAAQFTTSGKLNSLHPLPGVLAVLPRLRTAGLQLGIISNTGNETFHSMRHALTDAGLYPFFSEHLLIYSSQVGMKKDSPAIFRLASKRVGPAASPERCMFVGEDAAERAFASQAGMNIASSVAAAAAALTA